MSDGTSERALSGPGRPGGSEFACRFDEDGKSLLFSGPFGRVRATLVRGRIARDLETGLRALQFAANLDKIRDTWELKYDRERWVLDFCNPRGYVAKIRFFTPVPTALLDALADVFKRHQPAGSRTAKRREDGRRAQSMVQSPPTQTGGWIAKYRRMKAEAPEKFGALLTKARTALTRRASAKTGDA